MAFTDAKKYIMNYGEAKMSALNNEKAQTWFTSEVNTLSELVTGKFGRAAENTKWAELYNAKGETIKIQAETLKIGFMAGCARDIRILYSAGTDNRVRSAVDNDRFEFMQTNFINGLKLDELAKIIKSWEGGV